MNLVSRAFAWIGAALCGLPPSDDPCPPLRTHSGSDPDPSLSPRRPAPETWANFLAGAHPHRGPHPCLHTAVPPITRADINSTLVGAYLLPPEVRQHRRHSHQLTEAR